MTTTEQPPTTLDALRTLKAAAVELRLWFHGSPPAGFAAALETADHAIRAADAGPALYLVRVEDDVTPYIEGRYNTREERLAAAAAIRARTEDDGLYRLDIAGDGTPELESFSGGEMEQAIADLEDRATEPSDCDFCGETRARRECIDCGHTYCDEAPCVAAHEAIAAADPRSRVVLDMLNEVGGGGY